MMTRITSALATIGVATVLALPARASAQDATVTRPFGTLREQATIRQEWLRQRMEACFLR